jgi:hypothetical protein
MPDTRGVVGHGDPLSSLRLRFSELADEIAEAASAQTAVVGSGRVGRTRTLSLDQRAVLAARAYIGHHLTGYHDALDDIPTGGSWDDEYLYRHVKADAQRAVDEFLAEHRRSGPDPYLPDISR